MFPAVFSLAQSLKGVQITVNLVELGRTAAQRTYQIFVECLLCTQNSSKFLICGRKSDRHICFVLFCICH